MPGALLVSVLVAYFDRLNISLALPAIAADYGWTTEELGDRGGFLVSIFFLGYAIANMAITPLVARFGPRRCLMTIVVFFSCFTMLGAPLGGILPLFIATRFLLGLGEGVHFPMMATVTKRWFPAHERSRANAIWVSGVLLATVMAPWIIVPIVGWVGWRGMLVVLGAAGMAITLPVLRLALYDSPREAPYLSAAEADYIERGLEQDEDPAAGWSFLRNPVYWLAMLGAVLNNFCAFGLLNWLPSYFTQARGLPFEDLWYAASLPFVAAMFGIPAMAWLGDWSNRRAYMAGAGFLVASAAIYLATSAQSLPAVIFFFAAAALCQTAFTTQEFAVLQRILPHAAISKGAGLYNGMSMLVGAGGGSFLIGKVVAVTGDFTQGILLLTGVTAAAGVVMLALGRAIRY